MLAAGIVIIPQEMRVVPAQTVAENVLLGDLPSQLGFGLIPIADRRELRAPKHCWSGSTFPFHQIHGSTGARRVTYNAACLVVSGEGRSTIDETSFDWSENDGFSIPHWTWASHEANGGEADLFVVTDRAVQEHLDVVREELD